MLRYKNFARNVIQSGDKFITAAGEIEKSMNKTVPGRFNGETAKKALSIGLSIASELRRKGVSIRSEGYEIRDIVNSNDID